MFSKDKGFLEIAPCNKVLKKSTRLRGDREPVSGRLHRSDYGRPILKDDNVMQRAPRVGTTFDDNLTIDSIHVCVFVKFLSGIRGRKTPLAAMSQCRVTSIDNRLSD